MKMQFYPFNAKRLAIALLLIFNVVFVSKTFSNNLAIGTPSYTLGTTKTVTFTISWSNSWRNTFATPYNWDAVWVFVKFKDCTASSTTAFTHGTVSTTVGNHSFGTLEPTTKAGVAGIDGGSDNTGVMLRNTSSNDPFTGNVSTTITLNITNLPSSGDLDVRVFGIEMVYIPQGGFMLGDGNGTNSSYYSFGTSIGSGIGTNQSAYPITNESAQTVFENSGGGTQYCPSGSCAMQAGFPKGYNAFYMMKYEISQGQYAAFLNTLPEGIIQSNHFPNQTGVNRYTISNTGPATAPYVAGRPYRACNFLSWQFVSSYLAWAALRPLTELEYEKACRGTLSTTPWQYAWGSTTGTQPGTTAFSGAESTGSETITTANANVNAGNVNFAAPGDAGQGPLRTGIFATASTSTRQASGGSFYGVLDLSGNVAEYYVSVKAGLSAQVSAGGISCGTGNLDANGDATNMTNWPVPSTNGLTTATNIILRGGGSNTTLAAAGGSSNYLCTSNRYMNIANAGSLNFTGGRGGR